MLAQHRVQDMRGRVIQARRFAPLPIDAQAHGVAAMHHTAHNLTHMHGEIGARLLRVDDLDEPAVARLDHPTIAYLPTRLAVEGRLRDDHLYVVPRTRHLAL